MSEDPVLGGWQGHPDGLSLPEGMRLVRCGPLATMIEVESTLHAMKVAKYLRSVAIGGVVEIVPAARTVLVEYVDQSVTAAIVTALRADQQAAESTRPGPLVEIPTVYDGIDLADVAAATGLTTVEVIHMHASTEYTAAFCGFAPGFAYLSGLAPALQLPRRANPRPRVVAGSVAIGAEFTGVYPTTSPGGWNLLGRTTISMWDPSRARPSFIEPGDRVRFVPVDQ